MAKKRRAVFLDIDAPFEWVLKHMDYFREHLEWLKGRIRDMPNVVGIEVERSTSGYAHIIVRLDREISDGDENHLALAMGSSFALYVFCKEREKALGITDKVLFFNGDKVRERVGK